MSQAEVSPFDSTCDSYRYLREGVLLWDGSVPQTRAPYNGTLLTFTRTDIIHAATQIEIDLAPVIFIEDQDILGILIGFEGRRYGANTASCDTVRTVKSDIVFGLRKGFHHFILYPGNIAVKFYPGIIRKPCIPAQIKA